MASNGNSTDYSMYYVYNPVGTDDIKKVRIVMNITNDDILLHIISEEEVSPEDILNIINLVQENTLNKIRIDAYTDCRIQYEFGDKTYKVVLEGKGSDKDSVKIEVTPVQE